MSAGREWSAEAAHPREQPGAERYVLVVDDDPDVREVVADMLRLEGHAVRVASDGADALEVIASQPGRPSLLLLDLMMPRMSGWELLRRLRADSGLACIPICLMSAVDPHGTAGADHALRKPFDLADLLAVVGRLAPRP
ncbi:response regulator transcription factor [Anaeromyxobacter oryzae]|uniref:Response regulatory domain-containing protein n=1 Tax=Anaeromyxobacter oryzae TaxID=2918170 RepID=A0ABM7WUF4_9BACT|nr:response regulator [Anaeromyxobacter oryzae]BDG03122.1 hypothetical protein AMOR_21180 [Anaeromyxobacter oryzae]